MANETEGNKIINKYRKIRNRKAEQSKAYTERKREGERGRDEVKITYQIVYTCNT